MDTENTTPLKHQFIVHHYNNLEIIRCCIYCGLSHILINDRWRLIRETAKDTSFLEACPAETSSDVLPHHHFILSYSGNSQVGGIIIRFCIHCGLSHLLLPIYRSGISSIRLKERWKRIREYEKDMTLSGPCAGESEIQSFQQRYEDILE